MTKGQQAIVVAKVTGNWSVRQAAGETGQKRERIRQAHFVLNHASDLADSVRSGTLSLDNAYEKARIRKGRADTHESRFDSLKAAFKSSVNAAHGGGHSLMTSFTFYLSHAGKPAFCGEGFLACARL